MSSILINVEEQEVEAQEAEVDDLDIKQFEINENMDSCTRHRIIAGSSKADVDDSILTKSTNCLVKKNTVDIKNYIRGNACLHSSNFETNEVFAKELRDYLIVKDNKVDELQINEFGKNVLPISYETFLPGESVVSLEYNAIQKLPNNDGFYDDYLDEVFDSERNTKGSGLNFQNKTKEKQNDRYRTLEINGCNISSAKNKVCAPNMKPSHVALNQIVIYSRKPKKYKFQHNKENVNSRKANIDKSSHLILNELIECGTIKKVNGFVHTGSEAIVLHADRDWWFDQNRRYHRDCVIKIFKEISNESQLLDKYIKEDFRFKDRLRVPGSRVTASMWAEKEMLNIQRLEKIKFPCPSVVAQKKNILVMSLIGIKRKLAPKLKYAQLSTYELKRAYEEIIELMKTMYLKGNLVHADLSEYNILWLGWECWFIDFSKSVDASHPFALEFMMRDCDRISSYFKRCGLPKVATKEVLFKHVTRCKIEDYETELLRRKGIVTP